MTATPPTLALLAGALLALPARQTAPVSAATRLRGVLPAARDVAPERPRPVTSRRRRGAPPALAALVAVAAVALLGVPAGLPVGVVSGCVVARTLRRAPPSLDRRARAARCGELPAALDLLAVCLRAGLPVARALHVVAAALAGQLSADLGRVADLHVLGAAPAAAWNEVRSDPLLGSLARAAIRSGDSGSALAAAFERLAAEHRADTVTAAEAHARRAGVVALAPLGLCFLPAFVCLGVVPVVLGVARQVIESTG